jgi:hypothetical protein
VGTNRQRNLRPRHRYTPRELRGNAIDIVICSSDDDTDYVRISNFDNDRRTALERARRLITAELGTDVVYDYRAAAHAALDAWLDHPTCQGCRRTATAVLDHHRAETAGNEVTGDGN